MASGSLEKELVRLTIAAKGMFTRRILTELQPGRKVWMKAPYGDFIVRTSPEHDVVLIAGGTGITPFVAFMEDSMVQGLEGRVWLHYGAAARSCSSFATLPSVAQGSSPRFALPATPRAAQRARRSPAASTWQGPWRAPALARRRRIICVGRKR